MDHIEVFLYGCESGCFETVRTNFIPDEEILNQGLYKACKHGHIDVVRLLVKNGASSWDWGLVNACLSGDIVIVQLMIDLGARSWNSGLSQACLKGHKEIIKLMIEKGATCWHMAIINCYVGGHFDAIKMIFDIPDINIDVEQVLKTIDTGIVKSVPRTKEIELFLIYKMGSIPDFYRKLNTDDLYFLYKKGVIPSDRYRSAFDHIKNIETISSNVLNNICIGSIVNLIKSY